MAKKLCVIENAPDAPSGFAETFQTLGVELLVHRPWETKRFPDPDSYDAFILAGGPMGVYELEKPEYAFVLTELDFVRELLARRIPVLGVCLGHQILAHLHGADVQHDLARKEAGWCLVDLTDEGVECSLFEGFPRQFVIFQHHGDHVLLHPNDTTLLATSPLSGIQALSYDNRPVWSVQFHPEVSLSRAEWFFNLRRDMLAQQGFDVDALIGGGASLDEDVRMRFFENFLTLI